MVKDISIVITIDIVITSLNILYTKKLNSEVMMKVFLKLYAKKNLGDDLFLKILLERYPDVRFFLIASDDYKEFKYGNLFILREVNNNLLSKAINFLLSKTLRNRYKKRIYSQIAKKYSKLSETDFFVSLGGSIFIQNRIKPNYAELETYKFAINNKKDIYILGSNFGPYISSDFKMESRKIFSLAKDVSFRDSYSYNQFRDIENVRVNPDIIFGLQVQKNIPKIKKSIGFSIISERNGISRDKYLSSYAKIINYCRSQGYEIFLFSFCAYEGDQKALQALAHRLNFEINRKNMIFYDGNIDEFLSVYSRIENMFCGRFHSMILSMLYGQKIYPVVYSEKMLNVLHDIEYNGKYIEIESIGKVKPEVVMEEILSNKYDISNQINHSYNHFEKLDYVLIK